MNIFPLIFKNILKSLKTLQTILNAFYFYNFRLLVMLYQQHNKSNMLCAVQRKLQKNLLENIKMWMGQQKAAKSRAAEEPAHFIHKYNVHKYYSIQMIKNEHFRIFIIESIGRTKYQKIFSVVNLDRPWNLFEKQKCWRLVCKNWPTFSLWEE